MNSLPVENRSYGNTRVCCIQLENRLSMTSFQSQRDTTQQKTCQRQQRQQTQQTTANPFICHKTRNKQTVNKKKTP